MAASVFTASGETFVSDRGVSSGIQCSERVYSKHKRCQGNRVEGAGGKETGRLFQYIWSWVDKSCKDLNS